MVLTIEDGGIYLVWMSEVGMEVAHSPKELDLVNFCVWRQGTIVAQDLIGGRSEVLCMCMYISYVSHHGGACMYHDTLHGFASSDSFYST